MSYKEILIQNTKQNDVREISEEELKQLQMCMLECYKEINAVCEKYHLEIFLQGGSLLGAVRHGGFIPWDDDMDFGMSREDYNKFIQIFDRELSDRYIMSAPNSGHRAYNRFIQLFRKDTVLVDNYADENSSKPKCVYLDIFPIDYAPDNRFVRQIKGMYCNTLMAVAGCVDMYRTKNAVIKKMMDRTVKGRIIYRLRMIIGKMFGFRDAGYWFDKVDRAVTSKKTTGYVTSATGRKHYLGEVVPAEVFFPVKYARFEGMKIRVPNNPKAYLKNLYGDFMKIPPENKRERHFIKKINVGKIIEGCGMHG